MTKSEAMLESQSDIQKSVEQMAIDACSSLFEAYGVSLERVDATASFEGALAFTAVIGFSGPGLRGTCILTCTTGPLEHSNPTSGTLRDWIAELVNQLVGRLKNHLLRQGAEVYVTTPVVMRGEHLTPLPRFLLQPIAFSSKAGGRVFLWVEVEANPDFRLSAVPEGATPASEGDTFLF